MRRFIAALTVHKMSFLIWANPGLFLIYFRPFLIPIIISIIQIENSVDCVHGIQTRGCKMVGADETTELPLMTALKH